MESNQPHLIVFRRRTDFAPLNDGKLIPCYGVCCNDHGTCLHYEAIHHSDPNSLRIGHCPLKADGSRSLYRRRATDQTEFTKEAA